MKSKIVFLFSVLAFAVSTAAVAQIDTGFYGGVGIGRAKAKFKGEDFTFDSPFFEERRDETDTAYKFFGGYQLGQYIGAELSYTDLGKFAYVYNGAPFGGGEARVNYKATSVATSALARIPLGRGFSATGRLGVGYNTAERSALTGNGFTTIPPIPGATKKRFGLLWGVGAQYDFTPALGARLEFEDYGKFGEAQSGFFEKTGRADIHMYSLDFIARF
jgi:OmpA-OmpF porin, OOP family